MRSIVCLILCLAGLGWTVPARADVTAAQVETSIRRGIEYLQKKQLASGGWDEFPRHSCGLSALCTLSLVTAGVSPDDPSIVRAMNYLRRFEPRDTYSASLQTMVYAQVGAAEDLPRLRRNVRWLEKFQLKPGVPNSYAGAWTYDENRMGGDPSNSQFALLALAAAEERGVTVDPRVFAAALPYWEGLQSVNGGWPYTPNWTTTGSMTCAGIASMIICQGHSQALSARVQGDSIVCCGPTEDDDHVERGLQWLGSHFTVKSNPGGGAGTQYLFYYLYALERAGRMTGRRMIGEHDWYRAGAEFLVGYQDDFQGFWAGKLPENDRNLATSLALLFLAKGKRQVVLGRLEYGEENEWAEHSEGPRQLVRHLERDWGRDLTWQSVRLKDATVADMMQTPVLLISGRDALNFSADERQRLKQYVDQGGFLLFEAIAGDGCGSPDLFEGSVRELCQELFNAPLERLPPTHPIWFAERRVDPGALGEGVWVYGVQACCRTAVAYIPRALSCRWELSDPAGRVDYPPAVERQIDAGVALGQNIIAYATGRELKDKLEMRSVLVADSEERAGGRAVVTVPRLALDAGGEEARRAVPNLARYTDRETNIRITTDSPLVPIDADALQPYAIAWMHGRRSFQLTEEEVAALRTFLENGGFLLIDSICGDPAFAESVRTQLARVLPNSPLTPVPPDHELLTSAYGGFDLSDVTLRTPVQGASGALTVQKRQTAAVLEAATVDDRIAVLFSPYDLSCALESQNSIQCPGYTTEDAAKIGINMLLFALRQ